MGVAARWAGSRALGLGVADLADPHRASVRVLEVGAALRDIDGADTLILGCAGMADYREDLARATGLPVIEPSQAAVSLAIGRVLTTRAQGLVGTGASAA
jgi:Asp/Glu/hydantoin racemase